MNMIKKVKHTIWTCCLLFLTASCTTDENLQLQANSEEAEVRLSFSTENAATRVSLKQSEGSLDLTTQWKEGDMVDIFVVYNNKVEHIGEVPVRNISENGKDCTISYRKPKVVEDGTTEEYTLIGVVGAKTSFTDSEVYCNASLHRAPFRKFKVPAVFSIVTGFNQSYAVFKPYGVYEILHVKNTSDQKISFSLNGYEASPSWWRLQGAIRFSDSLFVDEAEAAQPYTTVSEDVSIPAQGSDAIVSWYLPNGNLIKDATISANINGTVVKSSNKKSSDVQIELEHAYHLYAIWDGKELKFEDTEEDIPESEIETFTVNGKSFDMVMIEGGTFSMGQPGSSYEPYHKVSLSPYSISKYEVTSELFNAVMESTYSNTPNKKPAIVSWTEALAFITRLNILTGMKFSFPTEAEWEYAARGGKYSRGYKFSGSNNLEEVAATGFDALSEVGKLKPNELGIYDMSGNVEEWCYDHSGPYSPAPQENPIGPSTGESRVLRGGHYRSYQHYDGEDCYGVTYRWACNQDTPCWSGGILMHFGGIRLCLSSASKPDMNVIERLIDDMVYVEGGTFTMGATKEQLAEARDDEKPAHDVTLSSFYICKYEMTEFLQFLATGTTDGYTALLRPASLKIGWYESDYIKIFEKLNKLTGYNFRLPTEAEWEYAARGGKYSKNYKYSGSNNLDDVAWTLNNIEDYYPMPGGLKQPNELGLYDMSGNRSELCLDYYNSKFYSFSPSDNPLCHKEEAEKFGDYGFTYMVFRGGSASPEEYYPHDYRVSARHYQEWDRGARLVLDNLNRK